MSRPRVELPEEDWPRGDRAAWEALFAEGDVLDGRGPARHWAAATRKTNRKHYARWLGWLSASDLLTPDARPAERATPALVEAYARSLIARLAPGTAASAVIGLKCVLQRMAPEDDWRWLKDMTNRLDAWAVPVLARPGRSLPAVRVQSGLLAELDRLAPIAASTATLRMAYRDALIAALLVTAPLRLENLAMIRIGEHLIRAGDAWRLAFDGKDVKNRDDLALVLPPELAPHLQRYLDEVRPRFRIAPGCRGLWPGSKARPLAPITIYQRVRKITERLFGVPIDVHGFRTIAATFLAESSPEDALHARALLGHRDPKTTGRHYVRASQIAAARSVADALREIRDA